MIIRNDKQGSNQIINLSNVGSITVFDNDPYFVITFTMVGGKEITWRFDGDKASRDAVLDDALKKLS
jgi:hypothetical protein